MGKTKKLLGIEFEELGNSLLIHQRSYVRRILIAEFHGVRQNAQCEFKEPSPCLWAWQFFTTPAELVTCPA
ncbi:hypothetical protein TNCV_3560021 [Trichonephila clavipes]|uniref:Uncharacterized protein n=1 Tax=Trichonephila clavipes TaxID=2585209 RepID=A0A8X7BJA5_TRICX|nr:hypothetical protein TNCV_3560021 [Trichonephila clavipes]